ncbi:TPR-like protein [Macroventuria anomochaeta]|uniref:TPR-like protein n=1 Tax=Macroventuria anomochaeta TaxID=301207 RepID=A0ACB6RV60_9PLEO|nr:TPR-like protein [Macroventuria anomochaeta]KAF2625654.1 TPR-like protein [Macroventuria anomochaeta]
MRRLADDALFMVPFSRDDSFVGREDIIAEISERAALQKHTRVALVGLGGIGKSQIAIEYAYRTREAKPNTLVVWIHASDPTRFQQRYRDIADELLLPGREDPKADVLQLVYAWLSDGRNGQWLMILDNVDDDGVFFADDEDTIGSAQTVHAAEHRKPLETFLPQTANGTILITSRNRAAAINLVGGHGGDIQVEPMEEEDALALLQTGVPFSEPSRADAKALIQALERIPLAITHAAAYIKTRAATTTVSTYLELFRESEANQVHLLGKKEWKDIRRDHSIRHAVIATWQISFRHIQKTEPPAANLLAVMSMFDKQGIPRWLLQANTSQLDFDDALAPLLSFSLVRTEIGEQVLEMHRLVQLSMRTWLEAEKELSRWVKKSIRALSAAFPSGDYKTWEECKVLLPHVKEVVGHTTEDKEDFTNQAKVALSAGWYLLLTGEYKAAEGFLQMAADTRERVLGPEHPDTLISVSQLGAVLERQGKYEEAETKHRRALEGYEKVLGPEHPDTLASVSQLGAVLERQGKYEEAEAKHRQALEGTEKVLGPEHPNTLISVSQLGRVLSRQGKYEEAEAKHRRDLEGSEKMLGPEHPDTLISVSQLGAVLERQGKYEEAEKKHRRALEGYEKVLGLEHPDTLTSVSQLGTVLSRQGKYEKAEAKHRQALEGYEKVLGLEHPDTLASVSQLGAVLERQGKYEEAEAKHRQALEGREKVLGPEHPDTLTSVGNLGSVLWSQGRLADAEGLEIRVMEGRKRTLGDAHPDTLTAMANLTFTLRSQGRNLEALLLMEACVQVRARVLGLGHPDTESSTATLNWWRLEDLDIGV